MEDTQAPLTGLFTCLRDLGLTASPTVTEGSGYIPDQETLKGRPEIVRAAVDALPNTSDLYPSRNAYLKVLYAMKAALADHPELAWELASAWAAKWEGDPDSPDGNDSEIVAADWKRQKPPFKVGAPYLYDEADKHSRGAFRKETVWFDPIEDGADLEGEDLRAQADKVVTEANAIKRLDTVSLLDAAASALTESTRPLIKGFLDQQTLSVLYGESNVGKTFIAMDIAFHVAAGLPWGGMKTTQMPVLYIAAEGGRGARRRAAALVKKYGGAAAQADFHFILAPVNLLDLDADLKPIIDAIRRIGFVGLVVIDTLSRALAGGDENASTDMGAIVTHFDAIRAETGAHVMVVHHTGKNLARGARGHSLLRAATDTEIEIAALSDASSISVTKQRDLEKNYRAAFKLEIVELGRDQDGDRITSCTIGLTARHDVAVGKVTPAEQIILDALNALVSLSPAGANGVTPKEIADLLCEQQPDINPEGVRGHLKNLAKKNTVISPARGKWAARPAPTGPSAFFEEIGPGELETVGVSESGMAIGMDVFA